MWRGGVGGTVGRVRGGARGGEHGGVNRAELCEGAGRDDGWGRGEGRAG